MITHYDMMTGGVIKDEDCAQPVTIAMRQDPAVALRLLAVQEAQAMRRPEPRLPADAAILPVESLLSEWS
jgi:hypothetical protein